MSFLAAAVRRFDRGGYIAEMRSQQGNRKRTDKNIRRRASRLRGGHFKQRKINPVKNMSSFRTVFAALAALVISFSTSYADSGGVTLTIYKAGWIIGGSGGNGTLNFHGTTYALSAGGLDDGFCIWRLEDCAARARQAYSSPVGYCRSLRRGRGGACRWRWSRAIVLTNEKGAVLELSGKEVGLLANMDLSGLAISLK